MGVRTYCSFFLVAVWRVEGYDVECDPSFLVVGVFACLLLCHASPRVRNSKFFQWWYKYRRGSGRDANERVARCRPGKTVLRAALSSPLLSSTSPIIAILRYCTPYSSHYGSMYILLPAPVRANWRCQVPQCRPPPRSWSPIWTRPRPSHKHSTHTTKLGSVRAYALIGDCVHHLRVDVGTCASRNGRGRRRWWSWPDTFRYGLSSLAWDFPQGRCPLYLPTCATVIVGSKQCHHTCSSFTTTMNLESMNHECKSCTLTNHPPLLPYTHRYRSIACRTPIGSAMLTPLMIPIGGEFAHPTQRCILPSPFAITNP